jgi:hypothetical protein
MSGLSPAQLRQAADRAMFGSPSTRSTAEKTTQCLQHQRVSSKLQELYNKQWSCKLELHGISPYSDPLCIVHDDILDLVGLGCKNNFLKGHLFRFSSDSYPPTPEGLKELARELESMAKLSGGIDLVSNGGCSKAPTFPNLTTEPQPCYRLVCNCGLIYQNQAKKLNKENDTCTVNTLVQYRKTTLHNDRLNDRTPKDDEKLAHKTGTCRRPSKAAPKCPFSLPLFVDRKGFLLKIGQGNRNHQYHARAEVNKVSRVRTALLSEQQREELRDVERAHIGKSVARNMFFVRHGIILSTEQIRYIARKVDMDPDSGDVDEILQRFFE